MSKNIYLSNTLTNKKEELVTIKKGEVSMYNCGPTVYGKQHIGNLSMFVFTDILRRTLVYKGYKVNQVINFTDFGHLTGDNLGDADTGEDKMSKGLKSEGLSPTLSNMKKLGEKYANIFLSDIKSLNVDTEQIIFPYASDYIQDQINIISKLEEKGITYETDYGVYFDTSKFKEYGKLGNINLDGLKEGVRVEKTEKRNSTDFVLWKKDNNIGWESPWGLGFPGWHIECSAMIIKILGEQIDIHTGGIEHIGVHHNNEIAQSECATGKNPFSRFWMHRAHLRVDDSKISKSSGTAIYLEDLIEHKIHPISFRYFLLNSHYKTPTNFTWEAVLGSQNGLQKIIMNYLKLNETDESDESIISSFEEYMYDDLNTPKAISLLQEAKSKNVINKMDSILGLNIKSLSNLVVNDLPEQILDLKKERDEARIEKDWTKSDQIRKEIEQEGYIVEDRENDSQIIKTLSKIIESL